MKVYGNSIKDIHTLSFLCQDSIGDQSSILLHDKTLSISIDRCAWEENTNRGKDAYIYRFKSLLSFHNVQKAFKKIEYLERFFAIACIIYSSDNTIKIVGAGDFRMEILVENFSFSMEDILSTKRVVDNHDVNYMFFKKR